MRQREGDAPRRDYGDAPRQPRFNRDDPFPAAAERATPRA